MEGLAEQGSPEAPSIDDVMRVREEYKQQLEAEKARSSALFRQLTEKHAKTVQELERSQEATIRSMESRRDRALIEAEMAFKSHTDTLRDDFQSKVKRISWSAALSRLNTLVSQRRLRRLERAWLQWAHDTAAYKSTFTARLSGSLHFWRIVRRRGLLERVFREWRAVTGVERACPSAQLLGAFGGPGGAGVMRFATGGAVPDLEALAPPAPAPPPGPPLTVRYDNGRISTTRPVAAPVPASYTLALGGEGGGASHASHTLVAIVMAGLHATRYGELAPSALRALVDAAGSARSEGGGRSVGRAEPLVVDWAKGFSDLPVSRPPASPPSTAPRSPTTLQWSPSSSSHGPTRSVGAASGEGRRPVAFPVHISTLDPSWAPYARDEYVWLAQNEEGDTVVVPPPPVPTHPHHPGRGALEPSPSPPVAIASRFLSRRYQPPQRLPRYDSPVHRTLRQPLYDDKGHRLRGQGGGHRDARGHWEDEGAGEEEEEGEVEGGPVSLRLPLRRGGVPVSARRGGVVAVVFTEADRLRGVAALWRILLKLYNRTLMQYFGEWHRAVFPPGSAHPRLPARPVGNAGGQAAESKGEGDALTGAVEELSLALEMAAEEISGLKSQLQAASQQASAAKREAWRLKRQFLSQITEEGGSPPGPVAFTPEVSYTPTGGTRRTTPLAALPAPIAPKYMWTT